MMCETIHKETKITKFPASHTHENTFFQHGDEDITRFDSKPQKTTHLPFQNKADGAAARTHFSLSEEFTRHLEGLDGS